MSSPKSKQNSWGQKLTFVLLSALALIVVTAIYRSYFGSTTSVTFKRLDGSEAIMNLASMGDAELLNLRTDTTEKLPFNKSRYTLLIMLSAGDCPNTLKERTVWGDLIKGYDQQDLTAFGVFIRTSTSEAKMFLKGIEIPFKVFLDEQNKLREFTETPSMTPFKVLLKDGQVVHTEGPKTGLTAQTSFGEKVRSLIGDE